MKRNSRNLSAGRQAFAVIVLAAGRGVRMKSALSKVLHPIAGKPMVSRTIEILKRLEPSQIILVASPDNAKTLKKLSGECDVVIQPYPKGTADATKYGLKQVKRDMATVAVLYGDDSAFYKPETILAVYKLYQKTNAKITFVTVRKENPTGLGRIVRENDRVVGIVEEKVATKNQKSIKEVNDGLYFFQKNWLTSNLSKISSSPVTGEYYITDLIELAIAQKEKVTTYELKDDSQWHGVNTREELQQAVEKFKKRIHIMGIAGAGAAAAAGVARGYGFEVTGCDLKPDSAYSQNLRGIDIQKGHDPSHLTSIGQLVVSPAVLALDWNNTEIKQAKKEKIPISTWQQFQGKYLQRDKFVIAVAGSYGKSTTTAMIAQILIDAGLDPTCEVGATVCDWGANFRVGKSKYYVCEADEYNDNFLNYQSDIAVVLNVAWDHPDYFKSRQQLTDSYKKFIDKVKQNGALVIANDPQLITLARSKRADIRQVKIGNFEKVDLKIIGDFRKVNARAALIVAKLLGIDLKKAKKSLSTFAGVGRRLEFKGEIKGVKVYDDYAVQPYTILATANALAEKFSDNKVVLVFEPHTFSRISTFFDEFVKSLKNVKVDKILVTDVYAAREKGDKAKIAKDLARATGQKAIYSGSIEQTARYLRKNLNDYNVILSMGAGDVYKFYDFLKKSYG